MDATIINKTIPDVTKIEPFNGSNFKRWQQRIMMLLDIACVAFVLTDLKPEEDTENYVREKEKWEKADKVCRNIILNALSNELFDVYYHYKHAREIWDSLVKKYIVEDAGIKKYAIGNFLDYKMVEEKDVSSQIHEYHLIINELRNEKITLPESFVAGALIEKLPDSWKVYKNNLKHKRKDMSLEDVIIHIRIEEKNHLKDKIEKAKENVSKANVVETTNKPQYKHKKKNHNGKNLHKTQGSSFKKKGNCFVCGKAGHYAQECRHRKRNDKPTKPNVNLVEVDDIIVAVVSEVNVAATTKDWLIDSGASKHICG